MTLQSLHMHTRYDDGRDAPRAMIEAALEAGLCGAGVSLHSPLPFANDWAAREEDVSRFLLEMRALREEYAGRIPVYAGLEWDALSPAAFAGFDYVIGSVHHLTAGGTTYSLDESADALARCVCEGFSDDEDAAARAYFERVGEAARTPGVAIVGHLDLIAKFSETSPLFCAPSAAYQRAALEAAEIACSADRLVEVNTGAISRGLRTTPYPDETLLRALARMGARIVLTTDAHRAQDVAFGLADAAALARACGFTQHWILADGAFVPARL